MHNAFQKWETSPHHLVTCWKCHPQPMRNSFWEVLFYLTGRVTEIEHHVTLDSKACETCHLSHDKQWKLIAETAGHKAHFKKAEIDCLVCHGKGIHDIVRPTDSCPTCHAESVDQSAQKMAFTHCVNCHNFLAGKEDLRPDRDSCLACHPVSSLRNHNIGEDDSCISCHKFH